MEKNPDLATQWRSLAQLPEGTLGAAVWAHYQNHGFQTPGELGGANAALAHHDWLHVLGNYDVTVIGEVENAAFGAASSNKPGATLWFLGVMAMYEGGFSTVLWRVAIHIKSPHPAWPNGSPMPYAAAGSASKTSSPSITSPWQINLSSSCSKAGASKAEEADLILGFQRLSPRQQGQTTGEREHSACARNPN